MRVEKLILNEERNVSLTAFIQEVGGEFRNVAKRPAILVLPGGGYQYCSDREADPVALAYLKAGYQAFVLRYSLKEDAVWPNPLEDYEQAMELIRDKAEEWTLYADKIAVIGFSAGGHLASAAATMARNRPNAAILGYAVCGEDVKYCNATAPDTILKVDNDTCPCFMFSTRDDNVVPIENSIRFMQALSDNNISFESHIYAYGPHGFSTCDTSVQSKDSVICWRTADWVADSVGWLRDILGEFGEKGIEQPVCPAHVTEDGAAFLSIDCTIGRLMGNSEAKKMIETVLSSKQQLSDEEQAVVSEPMASFVNRMKLRDLLAFMKITEEVMQQLNEKLSIIPNILR